MLPPPELKRGRRFDWLYEQMVTTGKIEIAAVKTLDLPDVVGTSYGPRQTMNFERHSSAC